MGHGRDEVVNTGLSGDDDFAGLARGRRVVVRGVVVVVVQIHGMLLVRVLKEISKINGVTFY